MTTNPTPAPAALPDERLAEIRGKFERETAARAKVADAHHGYSAIRDLLAEVDRLHSWDGLMSLLDEHYPADIFTGSSGDDGPRIIALTREVDRLKAERDRLLAVLERTQNKVADLATERDRYQTAYRSARERAASYWGAYDGESKLRATREAEVAELKQRVAELENPEPLDGLRDEIGEALVDAGGLPDTFPVVVRAQAGVLADAVLPVIRRALAENGGEQR